MATTNLKQFKGLAQHILFEELSTEHCHTLINLDVDYPVGRLSKRGGYTKKYSDSFTDLISAYEYKFPTPNATILIFNDNGALKRYVDGASLATISLTGITALEANFRNQYFGFKDHVLITTGNGSGNYVVGYYYTKRLSSANEGLFGNTVQDTGTYRLLKSQLIFPDGQFSRLYNVVSFGTDYYMSFQGSKYIEKRDSNFQLVERILAHEDAADGATVALAADATYIYVGTDTGVYKTNPNGWSVADSSTAMTNVLGLAVDADYVFAVNAGNIRRYVIDDFMTMVTQSHTSTFKDITCEPSSGGAIYAMTATTIERYVKGNFADGNHTHIATPAIGAIANLIYDNVNDYVVITGSAGSTKRYSDNTLTIVDTNTVTNAQFRTLLPDSSPVEQRYGTVYPLASTTPTYPKLFNFTIKTIDTANGVLEQGTFFYKIALEDTDGQIFTASDLVIAIAANATTNFDIEISCPETLTGDFYRIKNILVFRAYNPETGDDAKSPATNYKLNKTIDINDNAWENLADQNIYHYSFTDNTPESTMGSTTFQEMSGFSENTKPRYVNYKVHEWISGQLHCGNMYVDGDTFKNKIAKSQVDGPDVVPFANTYDFDPYDGDEIKNITTAYSRAYIMKNHRTGIFYTGAYPERVLNYGIADIDSYFLDQDTIYIMSNKGLFEINGINVKQINDPVITYFKTLSSFTDATVFLRDDLNRLLFSVPVTKTLIWNRTYNLWMNYNGNYAFKGYFKNLANQYIAFGREPAEPLGEYFWNLDDATQDNSVDIAITYESPLIKIDGADGLHSELTHANFRQMSTGTYVLTIYDYRKDSKATGVAYTIQDLTTISNTLKMLEDLWGESFSIKLAGTGTVFQFTSLSLMSVPAGLAEEMV